jgi:hypothetical protein
MTERAVFINCPFTPDYRAHFRAIIFTVVRSGFTPRCALETDDSSENRFEKICKIIEECCYAVHDISKTEPDPTSRLPRFNMPLELGLFLGAKRFGGRSQRTKKCIIFDSKPYRYQQFISDIAGQDIHAHDDRLTTLIEQVATWFRDEVRDPNVPGGRAIATEHEKFTTVIPDICGVKRLDPEELTFQGYRAMAAEWIVAESSRYPETAPLTSAPDEGRLPRQRVPAADGPRSVGTEMVTPVRRGRAPCARSWRRRPAPSASSARRSGKAASCRSRWSDTPAGAAPPR